MIPKTDGLHPGISDIEYHADSDSLSSSGARKLLSSCPAQFAYDLTAPRKPKNYQDFGHLAHLLVLGEGSKIAVLDPKVHGLKTDGSVSDKPTATAVWKEAAQEARDRGEIPIHIDLYAEAKAMAEQVHKHPVAGKLLSAGFAELSGYWHDPITGVRLRYRPDWLTQLPDGRVVCVDYKTSDDADPRTFGKHSADYGYYQQEPWYVAGLVANRIHHDPGFLFVVQEKKPPYLVSVMQHQPEDVMRGAEMNRAAIDLYARCRETGQWPGYGDDIHTIRMPYWHAGQHDARMESITRFSDITA